MKILIIYLLTQLIICNQDTLILIQDKVITKNDFIRRAEYTIRPDYCKSNNNVHKKVILNSLIAEKLFAIENSDNKIKNESVLDYIDGIKKQAMRKVMLEEYVNKNIKLDDNLIAKLYNNAQLEYNVNFITLNKTQISQINSTASFIEIAKELKIKPETKNINFFNCTNKQIWNQFYNKETILEGDLIGPILSSNEDAILISVLKKKRKTIINQQSQIEQYNKIRDYYIEMESSKIRQELISKLMNKKEMKFDKNTFINFANQYYENKKGIEVDTEKTLFSLDGKLWTVQDVINIINSHPLVFRESYLNRKEFYTQFKFALADLVRDYFLTNKAVQENYENHPAVINEVNVWNDYTLAINKKNQILSENIMSNNYSSEYDLVKNILNQESESLFNQYSESIVIDVDMFNEIELSRTDMIVININKPYQLTVPPFPTLTIKNNLNYGVKKPI